MTAVVLLAALLASQPDAPPAPDPFRPDPSWKALGTDLWFDPAHRALVLRARVVLREGSLEHLLCRIQTKEHEAILATAADARAIHAGLLLTGAKPGHPVQFQPEFAPPAGTPIRITLAWQGPDGQPHTADARSWIRDEKTGKALTRDWVFAGSQLVPIEEGKRMYYAAEGGDYITVANFMSAILDLPIASSANDAERSFVAFTDRIPPRGTRVTLSLQPGPQAPKP